jgi:hypothetical protein
MAFHLPNYDPTIETYRITTWAYPAPAGGNVRVTLTKGLLLGSYDGCCVGHDPMGPLSSNEVSIYMMNGGTSGSFSPMRVGDTLTVEIDSVAYMVNHASDYDMEINRFTYVSGNFVSPVLKYTIPNSSFSSPNDIVVGTTNWRIRRTPFSFTFIIPK